MCHNPGKLSTSFLGAGGGMLPMGNCCQFSIPNWKYCHPIRTITQRRREAEAAEATWKKPWATIPVNGHGDSAKLRSLRLAATLREKAALFLTGLTGLTGLRGAGRYRAEAEGVLRTGPRRTKYSPSRLRRQFPLGGGSTPRLRPQSTQRVWQHSVAPLPFTSVSPIRRRTGSRTCIRRSVRR